MNEYYCRHCERLVNEEDLLTDECPKCGREIVKTEQCGICKDYYNPDDLEWEICEDCYEYYYTFENAINFGDKNKKQIEINGYLASEFDELQIEDILKRELEQIKHSVKLKHKDYLLDNDFDYKKDIKKEK